MAALPYMPLYVADYLSDASHLSTIEHGAYLLLLMTYWQRGEALPADDKKLARICRLGPRQWEKVKPQLIEFFEVDCSKWVQVRVERELANVRDKSLKKRKAGLARAQQMHSTSSANAQLTDTDTDTEDTKKDRSQITSLHPKLVFSGRVIRLNERDFEEWRKRYFSLGDLNAELGALDDWLRDQDDPTRKKWFHVVSGALAKKHRAALKEAEQAMADDEWTFDSPC